MCAILCVDILYFPNNIKFYTAGPECGCNFHSFCIFFEFNGNLIFLVDPVTQGHKELKGNATQQGRTITETRTEVFVVIGEGLVTSWLQPQDALWSCTSDPVSATVCLCFLLGFYFSWMSQILCFSSVKQLFVNSEQIQIVGLDYSGDRGTVWRSLLFGEENLLWR